MEKNKIVVIGSYIVALVMDTDKIPTLGETRMARNYRKAYGGKGSNQAIQAARLGASVHMVSKIGRDADGQEYLELCRKEGIGSEGVTFDPELPTATGFIICSESGHNIITIDIGALNRLDEKDIDRAMKTVDAGDIVLLQLEINPDIACYAAVKAKERGAVVILNPAPAVDLRQYDLSVIDYLTPNETEARSCLGLAPDAPADEEELAKRLIGLGCRNVIVTLGENGSLLCTPEESLCYPSYKLEKVVDSTGAGDAFNAGLAVALLEKVKTGEAIRFASAAGAHACTRNDTVPSYGTRKEIEDFIMNTPINN